MKACWSCLLVATVICSEQHCERLAVRQRRHRAARERPLEPVRCWLRGSLPLRGSSRNFNPRITSCDVMGAGIARRDALSYSLRGMGVGGCHWRLASAHLMLGLPLFSLSATRATWRSYRRGFTNSSRTFGFD